MQKYIDLRNNVDYTKLKQPAKIIKKGGIVIFPTETVYGIGTNGLSEESIKRLYEVKKRSTNKPISLLVGNIDMINKVAKDISKLEHMLIKKFFPGPLTIILKKKDIVPNILTNNTNTVGIRMPANEIVLNLINYTGDPIATSSANISGKSTEIELKSIIKEFEGEVDCFIDNGQSGIGIASTVIQVIEGIPKILRKGPISESQITTSVYEFNNREKRK